MSIVSAFNYGQSTQQFAEYTSLLFAIAKAGDGKTDVQGRIGAVQRMTDAYFECRGERPDSAQLDRLASLILRDELTDKHPDKMSREEYPIMSDEQADRRKSGRHKRLTGGMQGEVAFSAAHSIATDGRDYGIPTRRERSVNEMIYMDTHTKPWKRDKEGNVIGD